ncbi:hypothetical protein LTR37_019436 [Vermiconidia calcicola]|uniref:Uncharacterized protein n=1 Tax=Vermiconidia calcicola TaxID=1690605 RepID=A0ACC3ME69_9PEZI|nr:hypothetical protein LTR37_019436 [Vermiconidia calcicola]
MAPHGEACHTDWIFSNNSNVHVANHRDWFTTFTDWRSTTTAGSEVLRIGDVELDVKISATRKGSSSNRRLILRDVLFVPSSVCNILGGPIMDDYDVQFGGIDSGGGLKDKRTGATAGLFDRVRLLKLWLVGQARGRSSLDPGTLYWINAMWSDEARAAWEASPSADAPPYTTAEKAWLQRAHGGEFKFLLAFGLKIHSEEDREEGRRIARGFIEQEKWVRTLIRRHCCNVM